MPNLDWAAIMIGSRVGSLNSLSLYAVQSSMRTSGHGEIIKVRMLATKSLVEVQIRE
jgi:hypothetical protein